MAFDWLHYANQGATRNQPLSPAMLTALDSILPSMGVSMEVFSGGQDATGPRRTGSTRHNHGNAADVFFSKDGRRLDWSNPQDVPVFQDLVREMKGAGLTGFGAGPGYMQPGSMHIGMGSPGVWGAGGRGANAPDWLRQAFGGSEAQPAAPPLSAPRNIENRTIAAVADEAGASEPPKGLFELLKGAGEKIKDNPLLAALAAQEPTHPQQMQQMPAAPQTVPQLPQYVAEFIASRMRRGGTA